MKKLAVTICAALLLAACARTTPDIPATVQTVKTQFRAADPDEGNPAGFALLGYAVGGLPGAVVGALSQGSTPRRLVGCSITAKLASSEIVHVNYAMAMITTTENVAKIKKCTLLQADDQLMLTKSECLGKVTYRVSSWSQER